MIRLETSALARAGQQQDEAVPRVEAGDRSALGLSLVRQTGLPIRIIAVAQTGQVPFDAGLPFFKVTDCGFFISRFALHFTQ